MPQSFPEYDRTQLQNSRLPRIKRVKIVQLWTEQAFFTHPFYQRLVDELISHVEVFFPGLTCTRYENPPVELNFQYLKVNKLIKTRVRLDTKRQQFNTENLFNVIMRNQLTPKSDECLFILTDSDLYPQDNWTFVFGVTRPNLRTLVQSIARHDAKFPEVSAFRALQTFAKRPSPKNRIVQEHEGGHLDLMET